MGRASLCMASSSSQAQVDRIVLGLRQAAMAPAMTCAPGGWSLVSGGFILLGHKKVGEGRMRETSGCTERPEYLQASSSLKVR